MIFHVRSADHYPMTNDWVDVTGSGNGLYTHRPLNKKQQKRRKKNKLAKKARKRA